MLASKNLVGGNCFSSPTIIALFALAKAPIASLVVIWLASSKITISNSVDFGSKYCATLKGDIKKQGQISKIIFFVLSNSVLNETPRPPLEITFLRYMNSLLSLALPSPSKNSEVDFESLEATSLIVKTLYSSIAFLYSSIFSFSFLPLNKFKSSSLEIALKERL